MESKFVQLDLFALEESAVSVFKIFPQEASYGNLRTFIELTGGVVLDDSEDDPFAIPIVDFDWYVNVKKVDIPSELPDDHFLPYFIYDCYEFERVFDLNMYKLEKSVYEEYDANEVLRRVVPWNDIQKRQKQRRRRVCQKESTERQEEPLESQEVSDEEKSCLEAEMESIRLIPKSPDSSKNLQQHSSESEHLPNFVVKNGTFSFKDVNLLNEPEYIEVNDITGLAHVGGISVDVDIQDDEELILRNNRGNSKSLPSSASASDSDEEFERPQQEPETYTLAPARTFVSDIRDSRTATSPSPNTFLPIPKMLTPKVPTPKKFNFRLCKPKMPYNLPETPSTNISRLNTSLKTSKLQNKTQNLNKSQHRDQDREHDFDEPQEARGNLLEIETDVLVNGNCNKQASQNHVHEISKAEAKDMVANLRVKQKMTKSVKSSDEASETAVLPTCDKSVANTFTKRKRKQDKKKEKGQTTSKEFHASCAADLSPDGGSNKQFNNIDDVDNEFNENDDEEGNAALQVEEPRLPNSTSVCLSPFPESPPVTHPEREPEIEDPQKLLKHTKKKRKNCKLRLNGSLEEFEETIAVNEKPAVGAPVKAVIEARSSLRTKKEVKIIIDPVKTFSCSKCEYITVFETQLKAHVKGHESPNQAKLRCSRCSYSTRKPSSLVRHQSVHSAEEHGFVSAADSYQLNSILQRSPPSPTNPDRSDISKKRNKKSKRKSKIDSIIMTEPETNRDVEHIVENRFEQQTVQPSKKSKKSPSLSSPWLAPNSLHMYQCKWDDCHFESDTAYELRIHTREHTED